MNYIQYGNNIKYVIFFYLSDSICKIRYILFVFEVVFDQLIYTALLGTRKYLHFTFKATYEQSWLETNKCIRETSE